MVIALDGPACSGKSTLAVELAKTIGYKFLNTGMIFRSIAYLLLKNKVDVSNDTNILNCINNTKIDIEFQGDKQIILLDGEDVSSFLSSPEVAKYASLYSQIPVIRKKVVEFQHKFSDKYDLVIEGRDIGTEVFPNAKYKFFVTASIDARVERRYQSLVEKYPDITKQEIKDSLLERDHNDSHREISPLRQAEDAHLIDTSSQTIEESVDTLLSFIDDKDIKIK